MDNVCSINLQFAQQVLSGGPGSLRTGSVSKACIRGALNIPQVSDTISARFVGFSGGDSLAISPITDVAYTSTFTVGIRIKVHTMLAKL